MRPVLQRMMYRTTIRKQYMACMQRRSEEAGCGGAGRTRRHLLYIGSGKLAKIVKKNHVKFQIVSFICLRVQ